MKRGQGLCVEREEPPSVEGSSKGEEVMGQTIYQDKEHQLDALFEQVEQGEEVILERADGRRFKLIAVNEDKPRPVFGSGKEAIEFLEGFEEPLDDFEEYM